MAVASRLAVARVSPEGTCPAAARRRSGLAAFPTARIGTRHGRAIAASPPRCVVEAVQMTELLTKEDLVAYLVP
jgi:glutamate--cysteine ligase